MARSRRTGARHVALAAAAALSLHAAGVRAQGAPEPGSSQPSSPPPPIAPPAPGADPSQVQKAQETAKAAEKTPIVPSPREPTRPAFQLYAELDLPVLGIGLVFASGRLVRTQPAYCAPLCNPADLDPLDRLTAGFYDPGWSTVSDIGLYVIMAASPTLLIADEGLLNALNDTAVVAEAGLSATAVTSIMTLALGRPRPFLFGTSAPLATREGSDASLSFLSSHTAISSAVATSTFMAMKRLHPHSAGPYVVLAVGEGLAAFVGTARVLAGEHFVTDAVGGMIVGTSLGVLVPALHESPVKVVPVTGATERGIRIAGTF